MKIKSFQTGLNSPYGDPKWEKKAADWKEEKEKSEGAKVWKFIKVLELAWLDNLYKVIIQQLEKFHQFDSSRLSNMYHSYWGTEIKDIRITIQLGDKSVLWM